MIKLLAILGIGTAGIGSVFGLRAVVAEPAMPARSTQVPPMPDPSGPERVAGGEAQTVLQLRGLRLLPVPLELATHLGLEDGVGMLVRGVEADSAAMAAGLQALDVLLSIDGDPADAQRLSAVGDGNRGLALRIVRAGVVQDIALGVEGEGEAPLSDSFLSWKALDPEHPFRRLAQLQSLRSDYSNRAEEYSQRVRELDDETRGLREQVQGAQQELLESCQEQIVAYLDARRRELLASVDQGLEPALAEPLAGLRMDLEELIPAKRLEAVDARLAELTESVRTELGEAVVIAGVEADSDAEKRARQRFARIGEGHARRLSERVQRAWKEGKSSLTREQERLGPQHEERATWSSEAVRSIRDEVRERVECAIDRSREELSSKLARRLSQHDVPAPGEIEACLQDLALQLENYTQRFIRRCQEALQIYQREVESVRGSLPAVLTGGLSAGEQASTELEARLAELREQGLAAELRLGEGWRGRARLNARADDLAGALSQAVCQARDAMRLGTTSWHDALREERVVSEDAWSDLRRRLSSLESEAESNCWKLDGPHLDGRFPNPESARAVRDEVAAVTR